METPKMRTQGRATASTLLRDPALFARVVLGANLWQTQREILTAVSQSSRVAVKASHASGKSYAIAIAALWWLTAHREWQGMGRPNTALTISPSERSQL